MINKFKTTILLLALTIILFILDIMGIIGAVNNNGTELYLSYVSLMLTGLGFIPEFKYYTLSINGESKIGKLVKKYSDDIIMVVTLSLIAYPFISSGYLFFQTFVLFFSALIITNIRSKLN